jgi:hypothetical protein
MALHHRRAVIARAGVPAEPPPDPEPLPTTWLLGVHDGNGQPHMVRHFESWLERPVPVIQDVIRRVSWDAIAMRTPFDQSVARGVRDYVNSHTNGRANWSMSMVPTPELQLYRQLFPGDDNLARLRMYENGATGAYNVHYRDLALNLERIGLRRAIFRVGYEWNLVSTWPWSFQGPFMSAAWTETWRQIVTTMRAATPTCQWEYDWNPTWGGYDNPTVLNAAWPGDDYVDVVGIDIYDRGGNYPCEDFVNRWHNWALSRLTKARSFARAHGKPLSIPEWGVWQTLCNDGQGGWGAGIDNPYYIEQMINWINANAQSTPIYYAVYFNEAGRHNIVPHPPYPADFSPYVSPNASAMFKSKLGG